MNDNLLSNGKLKDSNFARPITKNDDYVPYEVIEKYDKELARYKNTLELIRTVIKEYESKEWNCFNDMAAKLEKISEILDEVLNDRN
jgi:Na+/phosphate symporter